MNKENKFSIIIEARMNSSRLPGKVLMKIKNLPVIIIMIKRLLKSKLSNEIIVATSLNKKDNILVKVLKKKKIKFFRGSEKNVLKRVIDTCDFYSVNYIVKICGDSPLIDPRIVDDMIAFYKRSKIDYLSNNLKLNYPEGMDVEILSLNVLKKSYQLSKSKKNKEHVTYFIKKSKFFKKKNFFSNKKNFYPKLKLTLDYLNDFIFIKKIFLNFKKNLYFSCSDIIYFIKNEKKKN